ncbi:hypothetical protein [Paenibacillus sp. BGI2013]|uniref:hypothetical protein n=1 Tax=Paenibacillus sp. BGI2013 TaxID=2058902 RepID=UPI0015D5C9A1|nr:hypothetical protein [Paenibacillus sp. BGI2013]
MEKFILLFNTISDLYIELSKLSGDLGNYSLFYTLKTSFFPPTVFKIKIEMQTSLILSGDLGKKPFSSGDMGIFLG